MLEEVVEELLDEFSTGVVWLVGPPGSGKTTAAAHLLAIFYASSQLAILDEPGELEIARWSDTRLVIATTTRPQSKQGITLRLQPWTSDDLVEFLQSAHPTACKSVMRRLNPVAATSWRPQVARIVLDQFASDESLANPEEALLTELLERLPKEELVAQAAQYSLARLTGWRDHIHNSSLLLKKAGCSPAVFDLLRHREVQLPLATQRLVSIIERGQPHHDLRVRLPLVLIEQVGKRCLASATARESLLQILADRRSENNQVAVTSVLAQVDPTWVPEHRLGHAWRLSGGCFRCAQWDEVNLTGAKLIGADFSDASLCRAKMRDADLTRASCIRAIMHGAKMLEVRATNAIFERADMTDARLAGAALSQADFTETKLSSATLTKANLSGAKLYGAELSGADLTRTKLLGAQFGDVDLSDAELRDAILPHADLRQANLQGACLEGADLRQANFEDVCIVNGRFQFANLSNAYLTGSGLPAADLRASKLRGAHLAEIDWQGADLRGCDLRNASFHMGSSRSGLVGSPTALEGSMTGFYTDDLESICFKRPEEIRKASLRDADLRGANIEGVDFYLVDLRGTKLDDSQRRQARHTGAILDEDSN